MFNWFGAGNIKQVSFLTCTDILSALSTNTISIKLRDGLNCSVVFSIQPVKSSPGS